MQNLPERLKKIKLEFFQSHIDRILDYIDWRVKVQEKLNSLGEWIEDEQEYFFCPKCKVEVDKPVKKGKKVIFDICPKCGSVLEEEYRALPKRFESNISKEIQDGIDFYDSIYLKSGKQLVQDIFKLESVGYMASEWNHRGRPENVVPEKEFEQAIFDYFEKNHKFWWYKTKFNQPNIFVDIPESIMKRAINFMEKEMDSDGVFLHEFSDDHGYEVNYWHNASHACPANDYNCEYEND